MNEFDVFDYFSRAREELTGRSFSNVIKSESPDFLADDSALGPVGIELTDARPSMSADDIDFLQNWLNADIEFDSFDAEAHIGVAIELKDTLRQRPHWQRPDATILVVRVFSDLLALCQHLEQYSPELPQHGFRQIWAQDSEISYEKDGTPLSAAIVCLYPNWLDKLIYLHHRRLGFTLWRDGW